MPLAVTEGFTVERSKVKFTRSRCVPYDFRTKDRRRFKFHGNVLLIVARATAR